PGVVSDSATTYPSSCPTPVRQQATLRVIAGVPADKGAGPGCISIPLRLNAASLYCPEVARAPVPTTRLGVVGSNVKVPENLASGPFGPASTFRPNVLNKSLSAV